MPSSLRSLRRWLVRAGHRNHHIVSSSKCSRSASVGLPHSGTIVLPRGRAKLLVCPLRFQFMWWCICGGSLTCWCYNLGLDSPQTSRRPRWSSPPPAFIVLYMKLFVFTLSLSRFFWSVSMKRLPMPKRFRMMVEISCSGDGPLCYLYVSKMTSVNDTDHTLRLVFTQVTHQRCQAKTCMFAALSFSPNCRW